MKSIWKKFFFISFSLALCLVLAFAWPGDVRAEGELIGSGSCGEAVTWTLDKEGVLTISGHSAMMDSSGWYDYKKEIRRVVVEEGITTLNNRAFFGCSNLQSVSLPEGLEIIGARAFMSCKNLKEIELPGTVVEIGSLAFSGCAGLRRFIIPASVECKEFQIYYGSSFCTIYGYAGTAAQTYAERSFFDFQDLSAVEKQKNKVTVFPITKTVNTKKDQTCLVGAEVYDGPYMSYSSDNPAVTVDDTGKITIPKGFVGTAKITVRAAETIEYTAASVTMTLTVNPSATSLSGVKNEKGRKLAVKWKKNATGSGYQLQYSTDKSFKKKVTTKTIGRNSTTSATCKGLAKGKTYYVRIRTVKKNGKTTLYSAWSGAKSVKISK